MNQRLGNRSTRSILAEDNAIFWQYIELKIDTDPFCTSRKISTINKKVISKTPMKSKTPFKWVFMEIILAASSKSFTKGTAFDNYFLVIDAYSKIPKLYGMENITTE